MLSLALELPQLSLESQLPPEPVFDFAFNSAIRTAGAAAATIVRELPIVLGSYEFNKF